MMQKIGNNSCLVEFPINNSGMDINEDLARFIRSELEQCPMEKIVAASKPEDYFNDSEFWFCAPKDAMQNWNYCLSKLSSKEEIVPGVFIGAEKAALISEVVHGDFSHKSNSYFEKNDSSFHLHFKHSEFEKDWIGLKEKALGSEQERIKFTRIISVVKNSDDEMLLRNQLDQASGNSAYFDVESHKIIQLRDVPKTEEEKNEQQNQWEALIKDCGEVFTMIDTARQKGEPILVHCVAGRHRSVAILAAYLISRLKLTAAEAIAYIRLKRACAVEFEISEFSERLARLET
jgi:predicted protein tyrosine phosphatase